MTESRDSLSPDSNERTGSFFRFVLAFTAVLAVLALTVIILFEALKFTAGHGLMQLEYEQTHQSKAPVPATTPAPPPSHNQPAPPSPPATGH